MSIKISFHKSLGWRAFLPGRWYLTISNQWIIRNAWGERRVSSRALPNTHAYPECVAANLNVWWIWYINSRKNKMSKIVVNSEKEGHGERYGEEIRSQLESNQKERERAEVLSQIDVLRQQRQSARERKDFAEADRIRDIIVMAGIEVADQRIAK